eukprot:gene4277-biopygen2389
MTSTAMVTMTVAMMVALGLVAFTGWGGGWPAPAAPLASMLGCISIKSIHAITEKAGGDDDSATDDDDNGSDVNMAAFPLLMLNAGDDGDDDGYAAGNGKPWLPSLSCRVALAHVPCPACPCLPLLAFLHVREVLPSLPGLVESECVAGASCPVLAEFIIPRRDVVP